MKSLITCIVVGMIGASVFAEANEGKSGPCRQIVQACRQNSKGDKNAVKACRKTIMSGGKVEGISIGEDVVNSCKEKRAEHREHRKELHAERKGNSAQPVVEQATQAPAPVQK